MRTQDPSQVRSLQQHLDLTASLGADVLANLRTLAVQLSGESVLPLIGAGASHDCGMLLAGRLGEELLDALKADSTFNPPPADLKADLGDVAEEIYMQRGQQAVLDKLGLPSVSLWPSATEIDDHFCAYRVLARLAREQLFDDVITLNYDCAYEAGLLGEGMLLDPDVKGGRVWRDHVTVQADAQTASSTARRSSLVLRKIHGCAAHYRKELKRGAGDTAAEAVVVRRQQLTNWYERNWARDRLRQGLQENVLLTIGFSGQDPMIIGALTEKLAEIHKHVPADGNPRVIAIDHNPSTPALRPLLHTGRGRTALASGRVEAIETAGGSCTAALLVLLAERLAHELEPAFATEGYALPSDLEGRISALILAAPAMLRWSYLLRPRRDEHHLQRINLYAAAERGYVPLVEDPAMAARVLRLRSELRNCLRMTGAEATRGVLDSHGFLVDAAGGLAYLPTGLDGDVLADACRPGGRLDEARAALPAPAIDCVLVSEDQRGFTLAKGQEVPVP